MLYLAAQGAGTGDRRQVPGSHSDSGGLESQRETVSETEGDTMAIDDAMTPEPEWMTEDLKAFLKQRLKEDMQPWRETREAWYELVDP